MNGVGDGGSAITVDGSSAQTNPENRGFGNYGGQNQIEILSVESVAEVQVVKGVLAAEYGGSIGGQVNMITRSGTNQFHGSLLENYPERRVLVARSVPAGDDAQARDQIQPVRRIARRAHPEEPRPVLHHV